MTATRPAPPSVAQLRAMGSPRSRLDRLRRAGVDRIDRQTLAAVLGVKPNTIEQQRKRARLPDPDGHFGRTSWWAVDTVDGVLSARAERDSG